MGTNMKIPLVLVSGLLSNERLWRHQMEHLAEVASIQVCSPTEESPEKMASAILEAAPSVFALAGHSMGGWVCLEIMRRAPLRVSKLCLLNVTAREDSSEKRGRRLEMIARAEAGQFESVADEIVNRFVFNPQVKMGVKKMFLEVGREAFIRQEKSMLERKESRSILPTIHCPTLVVCAAQDKNFSRGEHEEIVAQVPKAKLAVIEDSGHMSPLEMPQAVTTLIRFWLQNF